MKNCALICKPFKGPNVGSTDYSVLHDIIRHDKLFKHGLVGATPTSAPTSRCFQCLQKNIRTFFMVRVGAHKIIVGAT